MIGFLTILGYSLYDTVVVFDKVRENTNEALGNGRMTYSQAANLAVNQTLVRSINTTIVALLPIASILVIGFLYLGPGTLLDLALALFVGIAVGAYSSIFIATPLLAHLKSKEAGVQEQERRIKSRRRHEADRYASVPVFTEDMAVQAGHDDGSDEGLDDDEHEVAATAPSPVPPVPTGRGRVVPQQHKPVNPSSAAGRAQPTRQPRSKRGKK
jgi:preprotein translocase subunit SecF